MELQVRAQVQELVLGNFQQEEPREHHMNQYPLKQGQPQGSHRSRVPQQIQGQLQGNHRCQGLQLEIHKFQPLPLVAKAWPLLQVCCCQWEQHEACHRSQFLPAWQQAWAWGQVYRTTEVCTVVYI